MADCKRIKQVSKRMGWGKPPKPKLNNNKIRQNKIKDLLLSFLSWILVPFIIFALVWIAIFDLFKNKRCGFFIKKITKNI